MLGSRLQIYVDHNVITALMRGNESLHETITELKVNRARLFYSPAHIEEVAVIQRESPSAEEADRRIKEHLRFISTLTGNWEYLPCEECPTQVVVESPFTCYRRVIKSYDLTLLAEQFNRLNRSLKSPNAFDEVQRDLG